MNPVEAPQIEEPSIVNTLWQEAPAWRNLVIATISSSTLAASLMFFAPTNTPLQITSNSVEPSSSAPQVCSINLPNSPEHVKLKVTGFVSPDAVKSTSLQVESTVGGKISPTYATWLRVSLKQINGNSEWSTMAAVPPGLAVNIGDVVAADSRYKDPAQPCNFVPWTISSVIDHPAQINAN